MLIPKQKYTVQSGSTNHTDNQIFGHSQNPPRGLAAAWWISVTLCDCKQVIVQILELGNRFFHNKKKRIKCSFHKSQIDF